MESTARDAMFADHYVVIAEDCVGSDDKAQHEASMFLMRHRFDLAGSAVDARLDPAHEAIAEEHRQHVPTPATLGRREEELPHVLEPEQ